MSAINTVRQRDAVHILADGAGYDAGGNLLITSPKTWPLPKHNAMFSMRGPALLGPILLATLSACDYGYDELRAGIVDVVREAVAASGTAMSMCQAGEDFDLVVAGWSESDGADSYVVSSHSGLGIEPWTVVKLGEVSLLPGDAELQRAFTATFPDVRSADDLKLQRDGRRILELQRNLGFSVLTAEGLKIVGGFAQLATVHKGGRFETMILHRWPDRVGERIGGAS